MNQSNSKSIKRLSKSTLFLSSIITISTAFADELNMMSTIDDEPNKIIVESVDFERSKSNDTTYVSIKSKTVTTVRCAIFDKNGRPVTVVEGIISPPRTKLQAISKNAMVTSVKCTEQEKSADESSKSIDIYYKMPTFLLDD